VLREDGIKLTAVKYVLKYFWKISLWYWYIMPCSFKHCLTNGGGNQEDIIIFLLFKLLSRRCNVSPWQN
jgi:hypothetical protein